MYYTITSEEFRSEVVKRNHIIRFMVLVFLFLTLAILNDISKGEDQSHIINILQKMRGLDKESMNERQKKLYEDVKVFETKGSTGIDKQSMFYPIYKTKFTPQELNAGLKNTGLEGMGEYFHHAEKKTGVNAIFLVALANHESNYGNSNIAKEKNNLFGFNAYDASPMESATIYKNYGDSIIRVSRKIKDLYLNEKGKYFKGYSTEDMNIYYSTDKNWSKKVNSHMIRYAHKMLRNR